MMKQLLTTIILAMATLTFIACGDEDPCADVECPVGEVCSNGTCVAVDPCAGITCEDDEVCDDGNCITINNDPCDDVTCEEGESCVNGNCVKTPVEKSGVITASERWTAGNVYILTNRVIVPDGVTLTIDPGVIVKGRAGTGPNASALIIARGAQILACGTESSPIIFTSEADNIQPGEIESPNLTSDIRGLWGGLIVLGDAPISVSNDVGEAQIEGVPSSDANGRYGGNNPDDNSGVLKYISIRHGGTDLASGNEINGLTLGGVGSGTTISEIEVVANFDDGIEFFGGNVSVENALVWACGDDALDTDQDWIGTVDNWVVAIPQGGSAMELDGPEGTTQRGSGQFTNGTIFAGANLEFLIDWDDNTNCGVNNVYIHGIDENYGGEDTGVSSFGGDGTGVTENLEISIPTGYDLNALLGNDASNFKVVEMGANEVGANASVFGWTLGRVSGTLSSIGL